MIGLIYFIIFYALQLLYCRYINRWLIKFSGKWRPLTADNYPLWFFPIAGLVMTTIIAQIEYFSTEPTKKNPGKLLKWFNSHDLKK